MAARQLILSLDGREFAVKLFKLDREKLYGTVEIEAFDEKGNEAKLKILAADGKTLIDKGGTALATVNDKGDSVDRPGLTPVDEDGDVIVPVESSFNAPNTLTSSSAEEYLSQNVKSVYLLQPGDGEPDLNYLKEHLNADQIYEFPFSYRGGVEHDDAFVIGNEGEAFMVTGKKSNFDFLKLNQSAVLDVVEEEDLAADDLDFDLL